MSEAGLAVFPSREDPAKQGADKVL